MIIYQTMTTTCRATLDSLSDPVDNDTCVCGVKDCPDAYAHTTSGF